MSADTAPRTSAQFRPALPTLTVGLIAAVTLAPLAVAAAFAPLGFRGLIGAALLLAVAVLAVTPNTWAWTDGAATRWGAYAASGFAGLGLILGLTLVSSAVAGQQDVVDASMFLMNWSLVPVGAFVLVTRYARMSR